MGNMTNCPNCGAPITGSVCEYCGTRHGMRIVGRFPEIKTYPPTPPDVLVTAIRRQLEKYEKTRAEIFTNVFFL